MKTQIGYKVVGRNARGDYTSLFLHSSPTWCTHYVVGSRTVGREGTPLLAFSNLRDASQLAASLGCLFFTAKLENPRPVARLASITCPQTFRRFWRCNGGSLRSRWPSSMHAPFGTVACDAITLLEEV